MSAAVDYDLAVRRGQLWFRPLSAIPAVRRGFLLHPDDENDPYVFRLDLTDPENPRLAGSFDGAGEFTHPHSYERLPNGNVLATYQGRGEQNVDPGGLVDIDMKRFIAWGMKVFAAAVAPMPIRRRAAERLHARMILDADLFQLGRLANFATARHDAPDGAAALPDAALRAVTSPTLALLAEHSAIMRPEAAAARARALLPDVTVEIVPDAGHGLPLDDAAVVAARVRRFLDAYGAGNRPATG